MPQSLSKVDICNLALAEISQKPIGALTDANELARQCNRWYDHMRGELLEECDWTFSRRTVPLNLIGQATGMIDFPDWAVVAESSDTDNLTADNDVFPWAYIYSYPPNVRFIHQVYNAQTPRWFEPWAGYAGVNFRTWAENQMKGWELIRSRKTNEFAVACNLQNAICKYTFDMKDESQFTSKFVSALALKLAHKICVPLTGDRDLRGDIKEDLDKAMSDAMRNNLSENPEYGPQSSTYEDIRGM